MQRGLYVKGVMILVTPRGQLLVVLRTEFYSQAALLRIIQGLCLDEPPARELHGGWRRCRIFGMARSRVSPA